jgi:hypothetical protein
MRPPTLGASKGKPTAITRAAAFRALSNVRSQRTRNLLRGVISSGKETPSVDAINTLRRIASARDLAISAQLLLGKQGAFPFSNLGGNNRTLLRPHSLQEVAIQSEIALWWATLMDGRRRLATSLSLCGHLHNCRTVILPTQ